MPIIRSEARRLYQCDYCGKQDVWGNDWAWFGSYKQLDDYDSLKGNDVLVMCSADCRVKLVAAGRLPSEGLDDHGAVVDDADEKPPSRKTARTRG